jgi:hypothetical protein
MNSPENRLARFHAEAAKVAATRNWDPWDKSGTQEKKELKGFGSDKAVSVFFRRVNNPTS